MTVEILFNETLANNNNNTATATRTKGGRAPLSRVNSNTPRTPLKSIDRKGKVETTSETTAATSTKSKRKRSKSRLRRKNEIYTPVITSSRPTATTVQDNKRSYNDNDDDDVDQIVRNQSAPQPPTKSNINEISSTLRNSIIDNSVIATTNDKSQHLQENKPLLNSIDSIHDASIPTVRLGRRNDDQQHQQTAATLDFGDKSNVVGKLRSLPFRIETSDIINNNNDAKKFLIEFEHIPYNSGFEIILTGHDPVKHEYVACNVNNATVVGNNIKSSSKAADQQSTTIIQMKPAESKMFHVLWKPINEGKVCEEIHLKTPWGRVQISVIGIAHNKGVGLQQTTQVNKAGITKKSKLQQRNLTLFHGRDNITYDAQQWEDEQCGTFMTWLNTIFHPENPDANQSTVLLTDEQLYKEWQSANELFNSSQMQAIRCSVEREVKEGRLAITPRSNRNVLDEVYVQEQLTKLLLSYTPRWLQLGLGVVLAMNYDESIKVSLYVCVVSSVRLVLVLHTLFIFLNIQITNNHVTKESLKKIIMKRVLSEPSTVRKYTGGKCKTPSGKFESNMRITVHQHALSQIMILVFFLDKAKTLNVLTDDPCLFEISSSIKSSEDMLISLCQDCSKQRSTLRHLDYEGISVSHIQNPLDEYDFYVRNLAVDLKDGVCLAKMIDIITEHRSNLLSLMRLPATSREHKIYNVNIALAALNHLGVPNISDITTAHIVAAHQPRILQLLWSTILYFELPEFKLEIIHYKASRLIQKYARRFMARRSYRLACHRTVFLQSLFRGFAVRTSTRRMCIAATYIQSVWRGHHAKVLYGLDLMSIITTQSVCRRFIGRNQVERMAKIMTSAATDIQKIWRGYCSKVEYGYDLMDIITVQSVCRRFLAGKIVRVMNRASTIIQNFWRGNRAKINYGCDLLDIIKVQSICRRFMVGRMNRIENNASIDIQRVFRGYKAQLAYGFNLMDIITVQSVCRRLIAQRRVARLHACGRKIQTNARMWAAKRSYCKARNSSCMIQRHARRVIASNHVLFLKAQLVIVQKACRGWLCRRRLLSMKFAHHNMVVVQAPQEDSDVGNISADVETRSSAPGSSRPLPNLPHDGPSTPNVNDIIEDINHKENEEEISFSTRHALRKQCFDSVGKISRLVVATKHNATDTQCAIATSSQLHAKKNASNSVVVQQENDTLCNIASLSPVMVTASSNDAKVEVFELSKVEAAVFIQKVWRTNIAFKLSNIKKKAAEQSKQETDSEQAPESSTVLPNLLEEQSATILQACIRRFTCQSKYTLLLAGVLSFQAQVRGRQARALLRNLNNNRREAAALTIQRIYRGHVAFDQFFLIKFAAILIQSSFRRQLIIAKLCSLRKSCVLIQARFRGRKARLETAVKVKLRQEVLASAVSLQRLHSFAAIQIQRVWRGSVANVDYILHILAAIKIQSFARRHTAVVKYCNARNGVVHFQANFRGARARQAVTYRYKKLVLVQAAGRRFLAQLEKERMIRAVECFAATVLQRVWRGFRANTDFMLSTMSAVKIQAMIRGGRARRTFAIQRTAASTLQRASRNMLTKMHNEVECFAATEIQRTFRGYRANVDFMLTILSAMKIQSMVRGRQTRRSTDIQRASVLTLQRVVRGFLAKLEMRRIAFALSTLQRAIRVMLVRRINSRVEHFAAVNIQRIWRGYKANVDFMLSAMSAIKIQSFIRHTVGIQRAVKTDMRRIERDQMMFIEQRKEKDPRLFSIQSNYKTRTVVAGEEKGHHESIRQFCLSKPTSSASSTILIRHSNASAEVAASSITIQSREALNDGNSTRARIDTGHPSKFQRHTVKAITTIQTSKKFNEVLKAVTNLEKITHQSIEDCKLTMRTNVQNKLFSILRRCNRSSPHLELIRTILTVLTNIAQHPSIILQLASPKAVDILTDLVQMFRDKSNIFALSSALLEKMLLSSSTLLSGYSTPENKKRLSGILSLCRGRAEETSHGIKSLDNVYRMCT